MRKYIKNEIDEIKEDIERVKNIFDMENCSAAKFAANTRGRLVQLRSMIKTFGGANQDAKSGLLTKINEANAHLRTYESIQEAKSIGA